MMRLPQLCELRTGEYGLNLRGSARERSSPVVRSIGQMHGESYSRSFFSARSARPAMRQPRSWSAGPVSGSGRSSRRRINSQIRADYPTSGTLTDEHGGVAPLSSSSAHALTTTVPNGVPYDDGSLSGTTASESAGLAEGAVGVDVRATGHQRTGDPHFVGVCPGEVKVHIHRGGPVVLYREIEGENLSRLNGRDPCDHRTRDGERILQVCRGVGLA